ncbi:hypothetical protein PRIPAC_70374 [Pristionchus pacificus]|uniref:Lipase n=1 Tax=Pristionchus pacificus TaxID=54126 RepID=A0A2A6C8K3_PRIPA|nr:hypothetical protein PRIPAC_70374 [Pristionchus pacificus]|eukprot:PDM74408.1 lipase [Pristionchus pacificus]
MRSLLLLAILVPLIASEAVPECKKVKDCATCAESHIHVFGFKENCRWCVETKSCGGPFSCPLGKAVVQRDPFKCPHKHSESKGRRYTDRLGRSVFAIALAARDNNATECLANARPDVTVIKQYTVECDKAGNNCGAFLSVSQEAKAIYIAYKGSSFDKQDVLSPCFLSSQLFAEFVHGLAAQLGAWEKFVDDAGVITYFHQAFQKLFIESGLQDDLMELRKKHPAYRLWLTGHSLGGSLASMTALYAAHHKLIDQSKIRLITFGEPRTGNVAFAKAIETEIDFRYRVVKRNDLVSNIPNSVDPNAILLTPAMFDKQPLFYRYLVHYDNLMAKGDSFKVCELSDDHGCRNLAGAVDINDHVTYFNVNHDEYNKARCPRNMLQ